MNLSYLPPEDPVLQKKSPKKKRIIVTICIIVFIALLGTGVYYGYKSYQFAATVFKSNGFGSDFLSLLPKVGGYSSDIDKALKTGKTVNILLLGYGGGNHDGALLTDSMMVISINPVKKNVALISIPRDLWVQLPVSPVNPIYGKINSAYEIGLDTTDYPSKAAAYTGKYGGGNMAKDVVSGILGIPVNYYVAVDFSAFRTIVDDLGGVSVNVPLPLDDYYYPSGDSTTSGPICYPVPLMLTPTTCRYWHAHFPVGPQVMNGEEALIYARSRHASGVQGTDFARSQRQQQIMVAIKDKALQVNAIPKLPTLMAGLQNDIATDLTIADAKDLGVTVKNWNLHNIVHAQLDNTNYLVDSTSSDGQYILLPRDGEGIYTSIQGYIASLWQPLSLQTELTAVHIDVLNATNTIGFAGKNQKLLNAQGITHITIGDNPANSASTMIYDYSNGKYPDIIKDIQKDVPGQVITSQLPQNPGNYDIVIILGADAVSPAPSS